MTIDKPEHQQFLLEMMKVATYPGHLLELAVEVKRSIETAEIAPEQKKP